MARRHAGANRVRYPLRWLIPAFAFLGSLLAVIAVAVTMAWSAGRQSEQQALDLTSALAEVAATDIVAGLRNDDPGRLRLGTDRLKSVRGLRLALLADAGDQVMFASQPRLAGQSLQALPQRALVALSREALANGRAAHTTSDGYLSYALPLRASTWLARDQADDTLVLLLDYDLRPIAAQQRAAAVNLVLWMVLPLLALSALMWLLLRQVLLRRIDALMGASRRIGHGDLSAPVRIGGQNEIAELGRAFDQMRSQLAQSRAVIERERASLEHRVQQRTAELTQSNRALARARDDAEAASRAKSSFLATVSHEIRTPLNGVLSAMELMNFSGLRGEPARLLATAQASARALLVLLNDLLDMAKIEAGRVEVLLAPVAVAATVEQVVATHVPTAQGKGITLAAHVDPAVPAWVAADAMRVNQVLGNLVSNAVKFTSRGGVEVRVTAEPAADDRHVLRFTVRDSGAGIAPDVLRTLFQPFEQGGAQLARQSGGTGLGLAICRGLAEHMGGRVTLHSVPGEGTSATLELTLAQVAAPPAPLPTPPRAERSPQPAAPPAPVEAADAHARRVLVVDDHPTNRFLLVRQLRQIGIDADAVADGAQALEALRQRPYHLVITDCEMPEMDGYALTRAIRASTGPLSRLPIVACTAHVLPEVRTRCHALGVDAVMTKPVGIADLRHVLGRWPELRTEPPVPAALADTAGRDQVLDRDQLGSMVGAGEDAGEVERELFDSFGRDQRQSMAHLLEAMARGDLPTLVRHAHRSKGACLLIGARALGLAYGALETGARAGAAASEIARHMERVRRECDRLEQHLPGLVLAPHV